MLNRNRSAVLISGGSLAILMLVRPDIFWFSESFQVPVWVWWYLPGGTLFFSSYLSALCLWPAVFLPAGFKMALKATVLSWLLAPLPQLLVMAQTNIRNDTSRWLSGPASDYPFLLAFTSLSIPVLFAMRFSALKLHKFLCKT